MSTSKEKQKRIHEMLCVLGQKGYTLSDLADLIDYVERISDESTDDDSTPNNLELNVRVTKVLHEINASNKIRGYKYIKEAIFLVYNNPQSYKKGIVKKNNTKRYT